MKPNETVQQKNKQRKLVQKTVLINILLTYKERMEIKEWPKKSNKMKCAQRNTINFYAK